VNLRSLAGSWNTFFFAPQSPVPIAVFRIFYGVLVVATLLMLHPDWWVWYGPHAFVSLSTMHEMEPGTRINLFSLIPQNGAWINGFFWLALTSASLLTAGLLTRVSSVIVFLCLTSIDQRNLYILHGGDTFLRIAGFFLIFAPAGAALSLDRLIRVQSGMETGPIAPRSPWAQRVIQFQLSLLYFAAFCWKVQGAPWIHGTALYYVYHLEELHRFPLPSWFFNPIVLKMGSWSALALEFSLGTLIWIKDLRYYLLACGLLFHFLIEYSLNIPLFEWDVLSAYILFIDPADLYRAWRWTKLHTRLLRLPRLEPQPNV
jgi:hypothetical protein